MVVSDTGDPLDKRSGPDQPISITKRLPRITAKEPANPSPELLIICPQGGGIPGQRDLEEV
jgi:hypothetical protein